MGCNPSVYKVRIYEEHHHMIADLLENKGVDFLNFDAHSDFAEGELRWSSWVRWCMSEGIIKNYGWVVPRELWYKDKKAVEKEFDYLDDRKPMRMKVEMWKKGVVKGLVDGYNVMAMDIDRVLKYWKKGSVVSLDMDFFGSMDKLEEGMSVDWVADDDVIDLIGKLEPEFVGVIKSPGESIWIRDLDEVVFKLRKRLGEWVD